MTPLQERSERGRKDAKNAPRDVRVSIKEQSQTQYEGLILRQFLALGSCRVMSAVDRACVC